MKKVISTVLIALIVLGRSTVVYAQTAPSIPETPSVPEAPSVPESPEAPSSPEVPESPDSPTTPSQPASEAPEIPDAPENPAEAPEVPEAPELPSTDTSDSTDVLDSSTEGNETSDNSDVSTQVSTDPEEELEGQASDGNVGDTSVETGDATNSVSIANDANTNLSFTPVSDSGSVAVTNDGNGSDSDNSGSVTVVNENDTVQNNGAVVINDVTQTTNTGENSASANVGNSEITTGDANTTGTIVNAVNTNVDGVYYAEFNIADDHMGDIILDFGDNEGTGGTQAVNTNNGSDSINNSDVSMLTSDSTFQNNDATIENNMTLDSNSGDNVANKNTAGDSEITTGDANVAANILNFANNNLAGNVVYAVVNIFGNLVGDIIFPESAFSSVTDASAENSGNGSDSTNTASVDQSITSETFQYNDADIENNLVFDANTGDNSTSKNTNGNSSIETGDASVEAQIINIANNNLIGGNWWLVIVNEAGKWVGKIFGADGTPYLAGSEGLEFLVGGNGEVTVANSGNGTGSENNASASQTSDTSINQTNTANIVNNLDLSANTGGNSASKNTGGDSNISTGDASIVANIVNFVNNNIIGDGKLFVTVVNVFGTWIGDFVSPGYTKESEALAFDTNTSEDSSSSTDSDAATQGDAESDSEGDSMGSEVSGNSNESSQTNSEGSEQGTTLTVSDMFNSFVLASDVKTNTDDGTPSSGAVSEVGGSEEKDKKVINVNLAWLLAFAPFYVGFTVAKKKIFAN